MNEITPNHYKSEKLECIDIIEDYCLDFCLGNAIKYILRAGKKDSYCQDLQKAIWYLERACKKAKNRSWLEREISYEELTQGISELKIEVSHPST